MKISSRFSFRTAREVSSAEISVGRMPKAFAISILAGKPGFSSIFGRSRSKAASILTGRRSQVSYLNTRASDWPESTLRKHNLSPVRVCRTTSMVRRPSPTRRISSSPDDPPSEFMGEKSDRACGDLHLDRCQHLVERTRHFREYGRIRPLHGARHDIDGAVRICQ